MLKILDGMPMIIINHVVIGTEVRKSRPHDVTQVPKSLYLYNYRH